MARGRQGQPVVRDRQEQVAIRGKPESRATRDGQAGLDRRASNRATTIDRFVTSLLICRAIEDLCGRNRRRNFAINELHELKGDLR